MRFSLKWLREWVPTTVDAASVAERLTAAGLEVDRLDTLGEQLDGVVVGEIIACQAHPDADRLRVCQVDHGRDAPATVVCGAPNARAGLKAALATPGTRLPGGMEIATTKLRGVESAGMLCSAPELGLGDDAAGLLELAPELEPGTPLAEALGLPDHVVEIDLTPNRADCLSLRGIARELAAIENLEVREPVIDAVPAAMDATPAIELLAPEDCPRYVGRLIDGIDPGARTPAWMVERLTRSGLRSRGPGVDVTNYVLLELGQPMHAFDADRIEGGIRVRRARPGDALELLDGQRVEPEADMLLICDHARPVALAGIMGGADSAVGPDTTRILLESAWFNPASIIGKGRRFGLATDSAHRFERGVDPQLQRLAIERATALILEIAGGRAGPVSEARIDEHVPPRPTVELRPERVRRVLGADLDTDRIEALLLRLGMDIERHDAVLRVRPPSARRDIALEVDLVEEVARLTGYDALPARPPGGRLRAGVASERSVSTERIGATLAARGFQEIMTWSFVAADDLQRLALPGPAQPLANPLNRDMAVLRTSLLPGLLRTARANLRHQQPRLRLFETGHVFEPEAEHRRLGVLLAGQAEIDNWLRAPRPFDFFDLKGDIEQLCACLGHPAPALEISATARPWLHPGQSAQAWLDGRALGWLGHLHPAMAAALDLDVPVLVAELDLDVLGRRALPAHGGLSRFPAVRRDLSLVAPGDVPAAQLRAVASGAAGALLERCIIFDIYQGEEIDADHKSVSIGLILRDVSRTLTDQEVDSVIARVVESLEKQCKVRLRG